MSCTYLAHHELESDSYYNYCCCYYYKKVCKVPTPSLLHFDVSESAYSCAWHYLAAAEEEG